MLRIFRGKSNISLSPATSVCSDCAVPLSIRSYLSRFSWGDNGHHGVNKRTILSSTGFFWSWSSFGVVNNAAGSYGLLAAHYSSDIEDKVDELLDKAPDERGKFCTADKINRLRPQKDLSAAATSPQSLQAQNISSPDAKAILLLAACERHDFDLASQIFKDLLLSGKPLSWECYLNLARAFIATDDCSHLIRFIQEVSELAFPKSNVVINRIILAFAECRQIDKVFGIFNQMKSSKLTPDLITYNTVLDMLGRTGRMNEMLQLFASIKEAGIAPDIITYNTLLNGLKRIGRLDMCLIVFKEMGEKGIAPDLLTYTAMIDSYGRSGNVGEALRLFDEMKERQISPSIYIYRSLINSLKNVRKTELATKLLEEMNSSQTNLACSEDFKGRRK